MFCDSEMSVLDWGRLKNVLITILNNLEARALANCQHLPAAATWLQVDFLIPLVLTNALKGTPASMGQGGYLTPMEFGIPSIHLARQAVNG